MIAAFDLATNTGVCAGIPGAAPLLWTWHLDDGDVPRSRALRLGYLLRLCTRFFKETHVDAVYYEAPLNIGILMKIGASEETVSLLRGAVGILEGCAADAGIRTIEGVSIRSARASLLGHGEGKADKKAVMARVRVMGHDVKNDNESDAFAVYWHACGRHNPRTAHLSSPLFAGRGVG
jgi:Holliday junction resolvasome RuvABC endonuclease subunit